MFLSGSISDGFYFKHGVANYKTESVRDWEGSGG
jgi:hypothetical protein